MNSPKVKVLVIEANAARARVVERLLRDFGYEVEVKVSPLCDEVWDWVADSSIAAVFTHSDAWPVKMGEKLSDLQDCVRCVRDDCRVFALAARAGRFDFDSEFDMRGNVSLADLRQLVAEHIAGACADCAQYYRSA